VLIPEEAARTRVRVGPVAFFMPTAEDRELAIRPSLEGDGVQLALIGKRGGLVEATTVALENIPGFLVKVDFMAEVAWARQRRLLKRRRREKERRHRAALARNPWLNGRADPNANYIVRPR
jgi:hypothetical protein